MDNCLQAARSATRQKSLIGPKPVAKKNYRIFFDIYQLKTAGFFAFSGPHFIVLSTKNRAVSQVYAGLLQGGQIQVLREILTLRCVGKPGNFPQQRRWQYPR